MAKRGISLSIKLIIVSTLLLAVVISLFGVMNTVQSRKIIDESTTRLQTKISESLRVAGQAQLQLLAEATRIALVQSDYTTLQTVVRNAGRSDERVVAIAVLDKNGTVLAHSAENRNRGQAKEGALREALAAKEMVVTSEALVDGVKAMTFAAPVEVGGQRLCTVFLAFTLKPVAAEIAQAEKHKSEVIASSVRWTLVVGLLAVLIGALLTVFQGLSLSRPLLKLARQADQIAGGDLQARVDIKSHDEIGLLGERFNYMAEQMLVLVQETMAKATMEKELEVASTIQATLVPDRALVELSGIKIAGIFKPATHCGGDWWSYYQLQGDKTLILVGDVTGHGVGSAMITAAAQGATSTMMAVTAGQIELRRLLRAMNAAIHATARGKFVMTCFASLYDPATRTLQYANAGHNFPYHYEREAKKLSSLVVRGNRLGDLVGSDYEVKELQVRPGDAVVWYTDGVVECEDIRGEEYGEKRFRDLIGKHAEMAPDAALQSVMTSVAGFAGGVPQKDDITVVIGKIA
jgi:sigma-B regulation protein RsbU (phosphoserine phosphatase)